MTRTRENSSVVYVPNFDSFVDIISDEAAQDIIKWINANSAGDVELQQHTGTGIGLDVFFELEADATLFALRWVT